MSSIIDFIIKLISLALILLVCTGFWLWQDMKYWMEQPLTLCNQPYPYVVKKGATVASIANDLSLQGVLQKPSYFKWVARAQRADAKIQAGEYAIPLGLTASQLLALFVHGGVVQHSVTLVEGWNFRQILGALAAHQQVVSSLDDTADPDAVMQRLGYPGVHPEGRFFPDTYHFTTGTQDIEILQRAYRAMQQRLAETWDGRAPGLPYQSSYEALTMASIIEKETGQAEERDQIAGVFVRRLKANIKLQTDPTVIYALGEQYDGDIRRKDLSVDSPYNTYRYPGLTPTPIAMPGAAAIEAAVHPAEGDALYFVAKGDGSHHFSATLQEHNRAVRRYQLKLEH